MQVLHHNYCELTYILVKMSCLFAESNRCTYKCHKIWPFTCRYQCIHAWDYHSSTNSLKKILMIITANGISHASISEIEVFQRYAFLSLPREYSYNYSRKCTVMAKYNKVKLSYTKINACGLHPCCFYPNALFHSYHDKLHQRLYKLDKGLILELSRNNASVQLWLS